MASSAQSVRYGGPAAAGPSGGSSDALNRILADLCFRTPKVLDIVSCLFPEKIIILPLVFIAFSFTFFVKFYLMSRRTCCGSEKIMVLLFVSRENDCSSGFLFYFSL